LGIGSDGLGGRWGGPRLAPGTRRGRRRRLLNVHDRGRLGSRGPRESGHFPDRAQARRLEGRFLTRYASRLRANAPLALRVRASNRE
jgi:hypothetical protein